MGNQIENEINNNLQKPSIIEKVSSNLIFFGFALPSCTGESDTKWLIQIYAKDNDGIERTGFANGRRVFDQAWTNRKNLVYKIAENFTDEIEYDAI